MELTKETYLQLFLIILALVMHILAMRRIWRSPKISAKSKALNILLVWVIPYIYALLVLSFSDKPPKKTGKFDSGRYMDTGYPGA
jgi:multisubunit Na+/H+ antiporter MnhF subunit